MAVPILGRGDIPTPNEIKQMQSAGAKEEVESESTKEQAAQRFKLLRHYFLSCPQAPKSILDACNTGKWKKSGIDVRLAVLDGEEVEKWIALDWYADPLLFPSIGPLPYPFYIHEDAEGNPLPLNKDLVRAVHEDCFIKGGPFEAWRRVLKAREKKAARQKEMAAARKERRREPLDRFQHELGRQNPSMAIHTPTIAVPGGGE